MISVHVGTHSEPVLKNSFFVHGPSFFQATAFLFFEEEPKKKRVNGQDAGKLPEAGGAAPKPPPCLLTLPEGVLREIVGRLPIKDVVEVLPFVTPALNDVARGRHDWPSMEFSTEFESFYRDYVQVCEKGREGCQSLTVRHPLPYRQEYSPGPIRNHLLRHIFAHPWKKLRKLHLCGKYDADIFRGLEDASNRAVFPVLEDLFLVEELDNPIALWSCEFPAVKTLTVRIDYDPCPRSGVFRREHRNEAESGFGMFFAQFANLEHLTVLGDPGTQCFWPLESLVLEELERDRGTLKKLKVLKMLFLNEDVAFNIFNCCVQNGTHLPSLEELTLEMEPNYNRRSDFHALCVWEVPIGHPALKRMHLKGITWLMWDPSEYRDSGPGVGAQ